MRSEMVETTSKRLNNADSTARIARPKTAPLRRPICSATSTSKSCTCSQACAPLRRAVSQPVGAHTRAGATVSTTSGRHSVWRSITGRDDSAKVHRCSTRLRPPGLRGTHSGARHTFTPRQTS
ncbi:hypothetical protein FQZ97_1011970 [compost metagenome]